MKMIKTLLATALLSASFGSAVAGPITVDAGWYGFCFGGVGSPAVAGCENDGVATTGNPFTFSLAGPGLLKVTDAFDVGDVFDVFVNSVLAFTTSTPGTGPAVADPDIAFASGYYSAGSLVLAAGNYSVDIFTGVSPFGSGGAYVEVESASVAVPEPGSLALAGLALFGLATTARRRKA